MPPGLRVRPLSRPQTKDPLLTSQPAMRRHPKLLSQHMPLLLAGLAAITSLSTPAAELRLRLLETTDLPMNLVNYDYYQDKPTDSFGLAKTATLIKAARAEVKNSLLFDNGDLIQGSPLGDWVARVKPLAPGQVHPAYKVLN